MLSTFAYSNICWIFCIGFPRYCLTTPWAPEVAPVIVSPVSKSCCPVIKSCEFLESSTRTDEVALLVPPVIVSPLMNFAPEPDAASVTILSPSVSSKIKAEVLVSWIM